MHTEFITVKILRFQELSLVKKNVLFQWVLAFPTSLNSHIMRISSLASGYKQNSSQRSTEETSLGHTVH